MAEYDDRVLKTQHGNTHTINISAYLDNAVNNERKMLVKLTTVVTRGRDNTQQGPEGSGCVFTTLHFIHNSGTGPII